MREKVSDALRAYVNNYCKYGNPAYAFLYDIDGSPVLSIFDGNGKIIEPRKSNWEIINCYNCFHFSKDYEAALCRMVYQVLYFL